MTREEAEEYAKKMTYRTAIYNLKQARCVPYKKATFIKAYELLDELEAIKTLGEEMRITQKAITDEKVLIGFNMAVALCNKHLGG